MTDRPNVPPAVREVTDADVPRASEVLARAFQDDPLWRYIEPDEAKRGRALPLLARTWIRCARLYGKAWTTDGVEGVALRRRPGLYHLNLWRLFRADMIKSYSILGQGAFKRLMAIAGDMDRRHAEAKLPPHWYSWAISVDPSVQGRGIGRVLMQKTFATAEAEGCACYLETTTGKNVAIHGKNGYRVLTEAKVPGADFTMWTMVRLAR